MSDCKALDRKEGHLYSCAFYCKYKEDCAHFAKIEAEYHGDYTDNSDLDQSNPVDCSADTWLGIYSRNPDLLD